MGLSSNTRILNFKTTLLFLSLLISFNTFGQTRIDIYDTTDNEHWIYKTTIEAIQSAETGAAHYNFFSASSHALCVDLGGRKSNIWVHENTNATDDLTFGFVFHNEDDSRRRLPIIGP
jgi:hypothetical protein